VAGAVGKYQQDLQHLWFQGQKMVGAARTV
jgi:hypothetical protein